MSTKSRYALLDLVRGMAALEVCCNHLRRILFVAYEDIQHPTPFDTLFFGATSFAPQAVVAFFVLSGFLIGGSVEQMMLNDKWSWAEYAVRRLSRLWTVLLPCLLLTLFWDSLGMHIGGVNSYSGALADVVGKNSEVLNVALAPADFLGNLIFLQTILLQPFGSNWSLWSLSWEFWYYVLFPIMLFSFVRETPLLQRIIYTGLGLLICYWLPGSLLKGGLIWLMGYAAWKAFNSTKLRLWLQHPLAAIFPAVGLIASLAAVKRGGWMGSDLFLGACIAMLIPYLAAPRTFPHWLTSASEWLSDISYTLYLSHRPVMIFIILGIFAKHHSVTSIDSYLLYGVILLIILAYAICLWAVFERNTKQISMWVRKAVTQN